MLPEDNFDEKKEGCLLLSYERQNTEITDFQFLLKNAILPLK